MTDFSASSPYTKPETLQGQCCSAPNSGLSGSSCASVLLPMPDSRQRSKNTWWNYVKFKYKSPAAFYRILLILWSQMKRTSSNWLRSAWWTWHISAPILCVVFLSLISPFHLRLALSGSLLRYLSPSWPIPQHPHHAHQTPSLSPLRANEDVPLQIQVCQGRVVLQSFCQCLTADKDLQTTWWNHLKCLEIHMQEISTPSTTFFSYFLWYSHIMWSPMKWKEQAQIHPDLNDRLSTSQHQSSV